MVKHGSDMKVDIVHNMRGGNGTVKIIHLFKEELRGKVRLCAKLILEPGSSIGYHEHKNEEEVYYIISGKGLVNDNGEEREINAGDAVLTGGGAFHSISCLGNDSLELMAVILLYA